LRSLARFSLAAWLCLAGVVGSSGPAYAQSDGSDDENAPPAEQQAPIGPNLQASDNAPVICDPGSAAFRYVEVRGTGFDAWATQRLVGNVVDGNGTSRIQWGSVWVSPQGSLTLEVNLCADPFRNRPALPVGSYTVTVGPGSGRPLAATSISLSPPAETPAVDDDMPPMPPAETDQTQPADTDQASSVPTPAPAVAALAPVATPTPLPTIVLPVIAPTPAPAPRSGPGSRTQPFPPGAPGDLADGWQLVVTGVTPDAWTGIHNDFPSTTAPASDQSDYMVRVQATFLGQGTGVFSGMRLALLSGTQSTYDQLHNACGTVPDMVPPNLMTPGGSVRGNVCFIVRATDIDSLVLFDNQSTESDRIYFALK
jgi:hypothetical protein